MEKETALAIVLFLAGIIIILSRMVWILYKRAESIVKTQSGVSLQFLEGINVNVKTLNEELNKFFSIYKNDYDEVQMFEYLQLTKVIVHNQKLLSSAREGKVQEYMGLTKSESFIEVACLQKDFDIHKTALLWELHNLLIWNFMGYKVGLTEGDLENAKRFMTEEEAIENIKLRRSVDGKYKEFKKGTHQRVSSKAS